MDFITAVAVVMIVGIVGDTIHKLYKAKGSRKLEGEVDLLRQQVDDLTQALAHQEGQVAELQERVDFAERLLAQRPSATRLPEGS